MATTKIQIKGQKIVEKKIKALSNPEKRFDSTVKKVARQSVRRLVLTTPKRKKKGPFKIGPQNQVKRAWTTPVRTGLSKWIIFNNLKSGKWNIATILNKGRKAVTPKRAKSLYIPLTKKGLNKGKGYKTDMKYKKDFILVKRVKSYSGTGFIDKEIKKSGREMTKAIIQKIRTIT